MFKSYLLLFLVNVTVLSSAAFANDGNKNVKRDHVSDAYLQLIRTECQLIKSGLALEVKKSASFDSLLANGHASWLENRQQKLVVDILKAKLAAFENFEKTAMQSLTGSPIILESLFRPMKTDSIKTRSALIEELATLRQAEAKLANGIATLSSDDSWAEGYRLRYAKTSNQVNVVAAKISLLKQLSALQKEVDNDSALMSATEQASTFTAAWRRPAKDSISMQLLITQAELQIELSQHHLLKESRRLAALQDLAGRGMANQQITFESKNKVNAIRELVNEQKDNLSRLMKDLDASVADHVYTSLEAVTASGENLIADQPLVSQTDLPALQSVLNQFKLGQAHYLKREATLKGEMDREILRKLEQAVGTQTQQTSLNKTSSDFSKVLLSGQQRELENYRWRIRKTDLQRDLADAEIALIKESDGLLANNFNVLVSTRNGSSTLVTLPSRFISNDPYGLQTTYSALAYSSPRFKARRPALTTRGDFSSVFRPVINRDALSYHAGSGSSRYASSYGRFNRGPLSGSAIAGFRTFRPPGVSPFYFPGSPSTFGVNRFGNNSNAIGRSNRIYSSSGPGYHGR